MSRVRSQRKAREATSVDLETLSPDDAAKVLEDLIQEGRLQEAQRVIEWLQKRRREK